jgi:UPF0716 protein FxsA
MATRRRVPVWLLVAAFVLVPLAEIYLLIQVGQVIGAWWTVLLLIAASVVGGWLVKREGARAWEALRVALAAGRMPSRELADGALILIGGTLMLTPGFLTDVVGLLFVLPFTRPLARGVLARAVSARLLGSAGVAFGPGQGPGFGPGPGSAPPPDARRPGPGSGPVVRGDVVDDEGRDDPSG